MTALPSRHFNTVTILPNGRVEKRGQPVKIAAEVEWYKNWPEPLREFVPKVHDYNEVDGYVMDFVPKHPLSAYLVNSNEHVVFWENVLGDLFGMLDLFRKNVPDDPIHDPHLLEKAQDRIKPLNGEDREHAEELIRHVSQIPSVRAYVHGDLCFSNILMDAEHQPMLIDPRGPNVIGNQLYDIAKLYHSVHGLYDFLVVGQEPSEANRNLCEWLTSEVEVYSRLRCGVGRKELLAMTALLFYTMLPLHTDDNKKLARLLNRAEELYYEWSSLWKSTQPT